MNKRIFMLLLTLTVLLGALTLTISAVETEVLDSGTCGENLTWTLDSEGALTISGTGAMRDYSSELDVPWHSHQDSILSVSLGEGVTHIGDYAFYYYLNLSSITMPASVTSIGDSAFNACIKLSNITIPNSVTHIGDHAFFYCSSLSSVTIPANVTSIGRYAFGACESLDGIWVDVRNLDYSNDDHGVLFNKNKTRLIAVPGAISGTYSIPEGVTSISELAFVGCIGLSSVTIPSSITCIEYGVFYNFLGLRSITIPESVTSIGEYAFYDCTNLSTVHYTGTEAQKADISIGGNNEYLTDATWHYECDGVVCTNPETPPTEPEVTEPEATKPEVTEPKATEPEVTEPDATEPEVTESETTDPEATEPEATEPEATNPAENPFTDITTDAYYFTPVLWAVEKGVTTGVSETSFAPEATCTRGQIVTFLWRSKGSPAPASANNPFTDVPAGQWYTDAVLWAVEKGITTGTSATTFSPDAGCTRGQVATFLWRAEGEPASNGSNIFTDIAPGAYYYDAVLWAVENSITNGMGDGTFAPDATCTRGQIVTFLYRAMV